MYLYQEVIPGKKTGKKQSNEQRTSVSKVPQRPSWQTFLHLPSHLRRQHIFLTHFKDSCLDCNCLSHKFTNRGWDGRMASLTWWTWVWAGSGDWWWTGKPGVLQSMGLQSVRHNWATELNWIVLDLRHCVRAFSSCGECGLLSSCSAWASHWSSFSCCRAQALGLMGSVVAEHGLSSCALWA